MRLFIRLGIRDAKRFPCPPTNIVAHAYAYLIIDISRHSEREGGVSPAGMVQHTRFATNLRRPLPDRHTRAHVSSKRRHTRSHIYVHFLREWVRHTHQLSHCPRCVHHAPFVASLAEAYRSLAVLWESVRRRLQAACTRLVR